MKSARPYAFQAAVHLTGSLVFGSLILGLSIRTASAGLEQQETAPEEPNLVELADGDLQLKVPASWRSETPRSRMLEHEFSIAPVEGDQAGGRMTIMRSGGGVEANIRRWQDQFTLPADADPKDVSKIEKKEIDGLEVHVVDLSGTFHDRPRGPRGPVEDRENYRMLAAIVRTKGAGDYFIKFYGPQATVTKHAEAFHQMIDSVDWQGT
jgi:hypothetical protein